MSRQTFVNFESRYLAAGAVASDALCHFQTIGSSSCVFFSLLLLLLGTVPFSVLLLCGFEALSALDASTWKSQRSENSSVLQQGFKLGLFRGCSGNCPPVLSGFPFPIELVLGSS